MTYGAFPNGMPRNRFVVPSDEPTNVPWSSCMDGDARFSTSRGSPSAAPANSDRRESKEARTNISFSEHKEDEGCC